MAQDQESQHPDVLIVDDLKENVTLLARLLEPRGYRVHAAYSGEEALESVSQSPPDVVLLDLVMPGLDGFQVCERLKGDGATRHIPVIIVTGLAEHEANVRALEAGADDFLLRPIDPVLLEARLRNSVSAKTLQDQIIEYQHQLEHSNEALEGRVRDRTSQLEITQRVVVYSLARLAESRDPETGLHLDRMRQYVRELALHLAGLPAYSDVVTAEFVEQLYNSSPLHDIGKVGIPDQILLKPARLTKEEFEIMKVHSTIGGDTLRDADIEAGTDSFLTMGRDIAYCHHEKWNGTGYPGGLKETEIPLSARLVALGDAYDAIRARRPYKEPVPHEKARELLIKDRGTHFDPEVIDAFLAREDRFIAISESCEDTGEPSQIQQLLDALSQSADGADES
ncbi:MAG: response regulator [bacterium]|nr:response regulator [bacterium]